MQSTPNRQRPQREREKALTKQARPLQAERKAPAPPRAPAPAQKEAAPAPKVAPAVAAVKAEGARPERRISTMNEAQIMDKLRTVVSPEDPGQLYSKIKKVGQGYVFYSLLSLRAYTSTGAEGSIMRQEIGVGGRQEQEQEQGEKRFGSKARLVRSCTRSSSTDHTVPPVWCS